MTSSEKRSPTRWPLVVLPTVVLVLMVAPLELEPEIHAVTIVFAIAVIAWLTEIVPLAVTSLLIPALLTVSGAVSAKVAFSGFGDPILFIFMGAFFMAASMQRHGLDRRLALGILRLRFLRGRPTLTFAAFMATTAFLSMWASNTATAAIMISLFVSSQATARSTLEPGLGAEGGGSPTHHPGQESAVLTLAYTASTGGLAVMVSTPPNAIAARFLGETLGPENFGYLEWFLLGLPTSILMSVVLFTFYFHRGGQEIPFETPEEEDPTRMSRGERVTLYAFILAIVGWSFPGAAKFLSLPGVVFFAERLHPGAVALIASLPLFITRDETGAPVLPWQEATKIDWGVIMLFGGGLCLGEAMMQTGLAEMLGRLLIEGIGIETHLGLVVAAVVVSLFVTEVCSNTATANMMIPIMLAASLSIGANPILPVVGVALAASCSFMLPIATGPNAIAYGTGYVRAKTMIKRGFILNLFAIVVIVAVLIVVGTLFGFHKPI